jgi:hypothetical protein
VSDPLDNVLDEDERVDLLIKVNETTRLACAIVDVDDSVSPPVETPRSLVGATISAKVKRNYDDPSELAALTVANRDDDAGVFDLVLPRNAIRDLRKNPTGVWDCVITFADGDTLRPYAGVMTFSKGVA